MAASVAADRIAPQRHHCVLRQRQEFQPQVERQKMAGGNHDHHAERGKQRQTEKFAAQHAAYRNIGREYTSTVDTVTYTSIFSMSAMASSTNMPENV